jgi:hypothetical protein
MNCENFAVVYWNSYTSKPITHLGSLAVTDMHEFAQAVVPAGVHYNIVPKHDLCDTAVPRLDSTPLTESENKSLFFKYLDAL